jgi:diguanylate cyclase (GGDEF)-like protein
MESPEKRRELSKEELQDAEIGLHKWDREITEHEHNLEKGLYKWHIELLDKEIESLGKDPLTGVMTRAAFMKLVENALNAMQIKDNEQRKDYVPLSDISVLFIDLDNFKHVNDDHGHLEGDKALVEAAKCISGSVREGRDAVGRFGGDEFCVFLPRTDKDSVLKLATKILNNMQKNEFLSRDDINVTASIGAYHLTSRDALGLSYSDVIKRADAAVYRAKQEGKNTVVIEGVD